LQEKALSIVAVLQARTSSRRLPGKVLKPLLGEAMLARQCERILQSHHINQLVIATSDEPSDDAIATLAAKLGLACYRGSLEDVLDRVLKAAQGAGASTIVRLTGDCPLIDAGVIDETIEFHLAAGNDYTCNCDPATFPDGLDTEVCRIQALEQADRDCSDMTIREHATYYIRLHPEQFKIGNLTNATDYGDMRWTVDEPEDFELVQRIYTALYPNNPKFTWRDVITLLEKHPEWSLLNQHHTRNAGALAAQLAAGVR
jgi:spore coat polysaccharide biosynthesis protein SpsF